MRMSNRWRAPRTEENSDLYRKMVFRVRKVWISLIARIRSRKSGNSGLLELRREVQSCGYEDVMVMWDILLRSQLNVIPTHRHPFSATPPPIHPSS